MAWRAGATASRGSITASSVAPSAGGVPATGPLAEYSFEVPLGAAAGHDVTVVTSDGAILRAELPEGASPGVVCSIRVPRGPPEDEPIVLASQVEGSLFEVTVPGFAEAGSILRAVPPVGMRDVLLEVPRGAKPGSCLRFKADDWA